MVKARLGASYLRLQRHLPENFVAFSGGPARIEASPANALDVFEHPFAYARGPAQTCGGSFSCACSGWRSSSWWSCCCGGDGISHVIYSSPSSSWLERPSS
jgi:hypothetical protein